MQNQHWLQCQEPNPGLADLILQMDSASKFPVNPGNQTIHVNGQLTLLGNI